MHMFLNTKLSAVTLLAMAACGTIAHAGTVPDARIREAASRTLVLLQKVGSDWKVQCVSCHHQSLPMMALQSARERGLPIDEQAARAHAAKTLAPLLSSIDKAVQANFIIDPPVSDGYALLTAHAAGVAPSLTTAVYARRIGNWQRKDGHFPTIDGRPPHSSSVFTSTALASRAIALYYPRQLEAERQSKLLLARKWFVSNHPESTEDHAFRLMGLGWTGGSEIERIHAASKLLALQRADGGWSQLPALESDPYSTGQALVALRQAGGITPDDPNWQRGLQYLLKTQAADGSWFVKSRINSKAPHSPPYFDSGFPYGRDQYISCAATAWAVMALLEALPVVAQPAKPLSINEAEPSGIEPWMEAALFGPVPELRALLDAGLDPNTATKEGTSLLMMAATDPQKVALLLERGAKVNQAAKSGYTPLLVASVYQNNAESVRILLEKGAKVKPEGKVMFNASPLFLAAFAGDTATVELLAARGAAIDQSMMLLGMLHMSPIQIAAVKNDANMVRALVKAGANVNQVDVVGMTALSWVSLQQKADMIRTLLELGANPKVIDKLGQTPIEHANSIAHSGHEARWLLQRATAPDLAQTR